jgi:hypothetical protein
MSAQINFRLRRRQAITGRLSGGVLPHPQVARTAAQITEAKWRVRGWLLWWWSGHTEECPHQKALADRLGIEPPHVHAILRRGEKLGLATLLAIKDLIGYPLDVIIEKSAPGLQGPLPQKFNIERPPGPLSASAAAARPRRRRSGGGA